MTVPLGRPTADTRLLIGAALRALQRMYRVGFNHVKAGVMMVDLQPEGLEQGEPDLFYGVHEGQMSAPPRDRSHLWVPSMRSTGASDAGLSPSSAARQGTGSGYAAKQEQRSPRYTTRLDEIPTARA